MANHLTVKVTNEHYNLSSFNPERVVYMYTSLYVITLYANPNPNPKTLTIALTLKP